MKKQILVMAMALMLSFGAMAQGKLQFKAFDGTITGGVKFAMNLPHFGADRFLMVSAMVVRWVCLPNIASISPN